MAANGNEKLLFYVLSSDNITLENITGSSKISTHYVLNASKQQMDNFTLAMSLNLFVGNLFRYLVLKVVTKPHERVKPINKIIIIDEFTKFVG